MMHYHFYILDNHHQIKESLRLEENTNIIKINNLDQSKKEWILSTPIILEYQKRKNKPCIFPNFPKIIY